MDYSYLLDFIVNSFTFDHEFLLPEDPVYIIFQVDGSNDAVSTFQKSPEPEIIFNFSKRIILQLENLTTAFIYASLCTYSTELQQTIPIGNAKIRLKSFPIGTPANISFPVFTPNNAAVKVGTINLKANIATMIKEQYPMAIPINTNYKK